MVSEELFLAGGDRMTILKLEQEACLMSRAVLARDVYDVLALGLKVRGDIQRLTGHFGALLSDANIQRGTRADKQHCGCTLDEVLCEHFEPSHFGHSIPIVGPAYARWWEYASTQNKTRSTGHADWA